MKLKIISVFSFFLLIFPIFSEEISPGIMRTPDDRFENLKDYPFQPNYMNIDG